MVSSLSVDIKANSLMIDTDKICVQASGISTWNGEVDETNFAWHHLILNHDFHLPPSSEETGMG